MQYKQETSYIICWAPAGKEDPHHLLKQNCAWAVLLRNGRMPSVGQHRRGAGLERPRQTCLSCAAPAHQVLCLAKRQGTCGMEDMALSIGTQCPRHKEWSFLWADEDIPQACATNTSGAEPSLLQQGPGWAACLGSRPRTNPTWSRHSACTGTTPLSYRRLPPLLPFLPTHTLSLASLGRFSGI